MFILNNGISPLTKFWLAIFALFLVNLAPLNRASAGDALKHVEISKGKNLKRRLGIPGAIEESYYWTFDNRGYTVLMAIDSQEYNKARGYKRKEWHTFLDFPPFVREGTGALQNLIQKFSQIIPQDWTNEKKVNFVFAFIQSLPYIYDSETTGYDDYPKHAIETLVDGGGDCEDTSILLASILSGLGFEVALFGLPGHLAIGVKGNHAGAFYSYGNSKYYYCETTGDGSMRLGQIPKKYENIPAEVMPISVQRFSPKQVPPNVTIPQPKPPRPLSPRERLQAGIKLYEETRFNEAIKSLRSALLGLKRPEQRAKAHVYLGCSKRGFGEADDNVIGEFQKALRHDPNQKLPPRIGEDHPVFKPMLEKAREKITGKLTITASPPQAKIWIDGSLLKRKMLGTGTASIRLFEGTYTVEGIFEKLSKSETVRIRPGGDKKLHLKILPIVKHDPPSRVSTNQTIPLTLHVISTEKLRHVEVHYTIYDLHNIKLERGSKEMLISRAEPKSFIWSYRVNLHSPSQAGKIMYFVKTGKERTPKTGHHQILVQSRQPEIVEIEPLEGAQFNPDETITVKAKVKPVVSIEEVRVYYDSSRIQLSKTSPSQLLEYRTFSGAYVGEIPMVQHRKEGNIWYFVIASNVGGRETKSEVRFVRIKALKDMTLKKVPPPEIVILEPRHSASFNINQTITVKAKVESAVSLGEVRVYYDSTRTRLSENSPFRLLFQQLENKSSLDTYAGKIPAAHSQKEGNIWYFVAATNVKGTKSKSEVRSVRVKRRRPIAKDKEIEEPKIIAKRDQKPPVKPIDEKKSTEPPPRPPREHKPRSLLHQGVWASHSWSNVVNNDGFYSGWERGDVLSLAFLSEGKGFQTVGAQLDYTYENSDYISAIVQWGPSTRESPFAFAFLGGITGYRNSDPNFSRVRQSSQITPLLGGSLKLFPMDRVTLDVTGSVRLQSANSAADRESNFADDYLHHYEMGIRLYISPSLNLRAGYGRWRYGEYDNASVQVGLGNTF